MAQKKKIKKRIAEKRAELLQIFDGFDPNKMKIIEPLVTRAAFIIESLSDIEDELQRDGWTEPFNNGGGQSGIKKKASADLHVALTKNLTSIAKQLIEACPDKKGESKLAELMKR